MDTPRSYTVRASSTVVRSGIITADEIAPSIAFSAPEDFGGFPGHWTPEHFLIASLTSCFVSTFSGMSDISHLDFVLLDVAAEGILERLGTGWQFTQIILRPQLRIANEKDHDRAVRLLEKAEKNCLIARSLNCVVTVRPAIELEEQLWPAGNRAEAELTTATR